MSGNYAYVTDWVSLYILDISDPIKPTQVGFSNTPAANVVLSGDYAYTTDRGFLDVLDISDPANPVSVGSCDLPDGWAWDIAQAGDYVYVVNISLFVVDVSDPTRPSLVGTHGTPGYAQGVAAEGNHVYVGDFEGGLVILRYLEHQLRLPLIFR